MKYYARLIDPATGRTRLGSLSTIVGTYTSEKTMRRYMYRNLQNSVLPEGNYEVTNKNGTVIAYMRRSVHHD